MSSSRLVQLIPVVMVFCLGLAVGKWSTNSELTQVSASVQQSAQSIADAPRANVEIRQPSKPEIPAAIPPAVNTKIAEVKKTVTKVEFSTDIESLLAQLSALKNDLYKAGNYNRARKVFEDFPGLIDQLIDLIARHEPGSSTLGTSIASDLLSSNQTFKSKIFERLKISNEPSVWLGILRNTSRMKKEDIYYISDLLPELESDDDVGTALFTLGRQRPDTARMNFDERAQIAGRIQKYQLSENAVFRASAIKSLYNYPTETIEQDLVFALNDPDFGVRRAVTQLIDKKFIASPIIKKKMVEMVNSPSVNMEERMIISTKLLRMNVSDSERQAITELREKLSSQLNSMSEEERIEIMTELWGK